MHEEVKYKHSYYALLLAIVEEIPPELAFKKMKTGTKKYYKWSELDIEDMIYFKEQGMTYKEIGKIYGISDQSIFKIIKRRS